MNIEEVKIRWKIAIDRGTIEALTHSLTHSGCGLSSNSTAAVHTKSWKRQPAQRLPQAESGRQAGSLKGS